MGVNAKEILEKNKMTLIASLPANSYELAKASWENGAHLIKMHINVEHRASKMVFGCLDKEREALESILKDCPVGVGVVVGADVESVERDYNKVLEMNFSFISLYMHHTSTKIIYDNTIQKMLAADYSYTLEEMKLFSATGADIFEASIVNPAEYSQRLSAKDIIKYKILAQNLDIPVVVPTQRRIICEDINELYNTGVKGLMAGAICTGKDVESIARTISEFRNQIDRI